MIGSFKPIEWIVIGILLVCFSSRVHALDPKRLLSQYIRQQWTTGTGFPGGAVNAFGQTADGYLWIGTDQGLIRFDGFKFAPVSFTFSNMSILQLLTDDGGELWIRPQSADIVHQKDGKFEVIKYGKEAMISQITAVSKGSTGGVLVSDIAQGTFRFTGDQVQKLAEPAVLPGSSPVISMAETAEGKIWMGTLGAGLFYLTDGKAINVKTGLPERKINCLLPISAEELWVGTDSGLYRGNGEHFHRAVLPFSLGNVQVLSMLRDRDSNVWVGTARGLLRINAKGTSFSEEKELRGNGGIDTLFEDREGNLWIGGARGIGRIRDSPFLTYSTAVGLPTDSIGPVFADRQNRIWFAPIRGGLYVLNEGKVQPIKIRGMNTDVVYSIAGGNEDGIWVGRQRGGITRLRFANGNIANQTYTEADGLAQNSAYSVYEARDGTIWVGTLSAGVSQLKDGRFVTYTATDGLGTNTVASILEAHDGTMWFATPNGLSAFANRQWKTYKQSDGLPSENVNCLAEDSYGVLWIGTSGGLAFFKSGQIQVPPNTSSSLTEEIFGIAQDRNKGLWIATSHHVMRLQSEALARDRLESGDVREYGLADGLFSVEGVKRNATVMADFSGKIWFALNRGLSVVDPAHISDGLAPAIAHIEGIQADGKTIDVSGEARIPPSQKRVTFSFTGLSLAVPEHVRFRYSLDGFDRRWTDPIESREAVYTNLGPGSYRFRVVASNSAGIWNGTEASLAFKVEPALWETWWFRFLCLGTLGSLVFVMYRVRLRRLTRQMNARFEERLAERTRIAQELHDTLLQGVLSASMQLHVASDCVGTDSPAKPLLNRVLELMGLVVEDGRNAIRGLRLSKDGIQDLDQAFSRLPKELAIQTQTGFRVLVEGSSRPLHPLIRDEVYRIGREAVANAVRHSAAKTIIVKLEYSAHEFRILVTDDGCGIDPQVLHSGREDHWGLSGMRERSEKIGAKLKVSSKIGDGTEVDLRVPGRSAFPSHNSGKAAKWISKV